MYVVADERVPIKIWAEEVEDGAMKQARNLANLPFAFKHVALMPDVHQGYGMPIGGVLATEGVVICNAVGVDIGCGMVAQRTSIPVGDSITTEKIKSILGKIRAVVPVGRGRHEDRQADTLMPSGAYDCLVVKRQYLSALTQVGTLGGGNHFIELQSGDDGFLWVMIHSGSRNLGYKVAQYYNNLAKKLNQRWHSAIPKKHDLAFLPIETDEAKDYIREMNYCVEFAKSNRRLMLDRVLRCILDIYPSALASGLATEQFGNRAIDVAHNYARFENHFGKNVMVHRKGATSAREGEVGIIPGSQGTHSYIVVGKGCPDSFASCSHGAGRKMSRTVARKTLNVEDEIAEMGNTHV